MSKVTDPVSGLTLEIADYVPVPGIKHVDLYGWPCPRPYPRVTQIPNRLKGTTIKQNGDAT